MEEERGQVSLMLLTQAHLEIEIEGEDEPSKDVLL